jgi:hypothetical protein
MGCKYSDFLGQKFCLRDSIFNNICLIIDLASKSYSFFSFDEAPHLPKIAA